MTFNLEVNSNQISVLANYPFFFAILTTKDMYIQYTMIRIIDTNESFHFFNGFIFFETRKKDISHDSSNWEVYNPIKKKETKFLNE